MNTGDRDGIDHGVGGLGGVLGVTPAVQLHDARLACVYLVTFCMAATFFREHLRLFTDLLEDGFPVMLVMAQVKRDAVGSTRWRLYQRCLVYAWGYYG